MALTDLRPRPCARRRMNMYYLIDTSGSMNHNGCIQSVNEAMPEIVEILRDVTAGNKDYGDIYLQCIAFSDTARLIDPVPVSAADYSWDTLEAYGLTNLAGAFELLDSRMRDTATEGGSCLRPAVVLLSDGDPDEGWEEALERLRDNPMFRDAYRIAIAIGASPANVAMRRALTGFADSGTSVPNIISVTDLSRLTDVIRMVSATVSRIGSRTASSNSGAKGDPVAEAVHKALAGGVEPIDGVDIPAIGPDSDFWD